MKKWKGSGFALIIALVLVATGMAVARTTLIITLPDNPWILANFAGIPTYTGDISGFRDHGNGRIAEPAFIRDGTCAGSYYCIRITTPANNPYPTGTNAWVAFMNMTISDGVINGRYGASIFIDGDGEGWNDYASVFMSHVTLAPNWPPWVGFDTTNFDGMTVDGGHIHGCVYLEDVNISGWADAALDLKTGCLQAVRLHTEGSGFNTLKIWAYDDAHALRPLYLVDSTINNSTYADFSIPPDWAEGGLLWSYDCSKLKLKIWNSTFNGSPTIPRDRITCLYGDSSQMEITYLKTDPRKTGEMHPMFTGR